MTLRSLSATVLVLALARGGSCGPAPRQPSSPPPPPPPAAPVTVKRGVEVGWVARTPRITAPVDVSGPVTAGWPQEGRAVTWVAHVINRTGATLAAVPFEWRVGNVRSAGVVTLAPGTTEVRLPWLWSFRRHQITFTIAPPAAANDVVTTDNSVTFASDALSLMLRVERSLYDWLLESDRPGFEALFQRELLAWNAILARAVFPSSPSGALDRIRLDHVMVVPDGQAAQGKDLLEWDLWWGFQAAGPGTLFLSKLSPAAVVANQTVVLHELLHARGLTDLYAYDVAHRPGTDAQINIMEGARQVAGSFLMPAINRTAETWFMYPTPVNGLMGSIYRPTAELTEHCVWGLNLWAGRRTPLRVDQWGNYLNLFGNVRFPGSYLWKLPRETELRFVTTDGVPVANPTVDVYPDYHWETYRESYRAEPDRTLPPGPGGSALLPGDILEGPPPWGTPPKSQVLILGVRTPQARGFAFLPVYYLNLEYFRGRRDRGALQVRVAMHPW